VIGQFTVSIALLIGIGIISEQLLYFRNKELGFNKEQVIVIRSRPEINQQFSAFENELLKSPGILQVTRALGSIPGDPTWIYRVVPEGTPREKPKAMPILYVDFDFAKVLDLQFAAGRDFSEDFPADRLNAFILNETAARELGWEGDAPGRKIEYFGAGSPEIEKTGQVVGVVKDFHFESLHQKVQPLLLTVTWPQIGHTLAKISPDNIPATLDYLEQTWHKFAPLWPLEFTFLDKTLEQQYRKEARLSQIIQYFTFLAVFIACLGLFGLSSFTAEQRTKEIGVRKILGASAAQLVFLLTRQFLWLVCLANLIAWPAAYLVMNSWLQNFAYRIDISWITFALAGGIALLIAILTVSYQAIKAAFSNPVEALRYE
jgi:putative ABC transport system permease protein